MSCSSSSYVDHVSSASSKSHRLILNIQREVGVSTVKLDGHKGAQEIQYAIGDYVMVSRATQRRHKKLQLNWIGPFQVVAIDSPLVYKVRSLLDDTERFVHACRLRFYADKFLNVTEDILDQFARDPRGFEVNKIVDHKFDTPTRAICLKSDGGVWRTPTIHIALESEHQQIEVQMLKDLGESHGRTLRITSLNGSYVSLDARIAINKYSSHFAV